VQLKRITPCFAVVWEVKDQWQIVVVKARLNMSHHHTLIANRANFR